MANQIHLHFGNEWQKSENAFATGYAYHGNRLYQGGELGEFLSRGPISQISSKLEQLNGHFAFALTKEGRAAAGVDRIRSLPLFYAEVADDVYISDDAYWISDLLGERPFEPLSSAEFLLTGYVTSSNTLDPQVRQLLAGEMLSIDSTLRPQVSTTAYYRYLPTESAIDFQSARLSWGNVLRRTFQRLIRSLDGRPVVIPLSAGFDSHTIAMMLKRLKYNDVSCFSYGVEGNWESMVSEKFARKLDYDWEFVPYTHKRWYHWFHSEKGKNCMRYADGLTSVPLIQDWPAIEFLSKKRMVPKDSIFVPGHAGDFLGGHHIPMWFGRARRIGIQKMVRQIEHTNYSLWDIERLDGLCDRWRIPLRRKITDACDGLSCDRVQDAASVYEYWIWRERQSKFIANSVRGYEFYRYAWRMPFWDAEPMSFWQGIPFHLRYQKRLYDEWARSLEKRFRFTRPANKNLARYNLRRFLMATHTYETAMKFGLVDAAFSMITKLTFPRQYQTHPLAWYGIMPYEKFQSLCSRRPTIVYSFLAMERLGITSF